jgi:membrane protease YdiL (CAAX protease family)
MHKEFGAALIAAPLFIFFVITFTPIEFSLARWRDVWFVISACLLYPLVEEIVFRGLFQHQLNKLKWARRIFLYTSVSNYVVSVCFALLHFLIFINFLALLVFIPSIVLGYFYNKTSSVAPSFILHSFYNICAICISPLW